MTTKTQNKLPLVAQAILIAALLFAAARASAITKAFEVNVRVRFVQLQPTSTWPQKFDWYPKALGDRPLIATLTDAQFQVVLKALEQHEGAYLLSDKQVTTPSGSKVQLQPARNGAPINPNLGIVVKVSSDGLTIQSLLHRETVFSASEALKDGQTLVLGGLSPNLLIFVTTTVIDASGNPIHSKDYYDGPSF